MAEADEVVSGAGDGDVEEVGARVEEGEGAWVCDDAAKQDDAAFAALKTVDGAERQAGAAPQASAFGLRQLRAALQGNATLQKASAQLFELPAVGRDDGNFFGMYAAICKLSSKASVSRSSRSLYQLPESRACSPRKSMSETGCRR